MILQAITPRVTFGAKAMREKVLRLEEAINDQPQVDCPVRHYFAPGLYAREMTIPGGVVAVGAVHKTEHITIISKGRVQLMTEDGIKEFAAPAIIVSKAGIKRAAYAVEETVITTFHPTDETDPEKLVELLTESKASELLGGKDNKQLIQNKGLTCLSE